MDSLSGSNPRGTAQERVDSTIEDHTQAIRPANQGDLSSHYVFQNFTELDDLGDCFYSDLLAKHDSQGNGATEVSHTSSSISMEASGMLCRLIRTQSLDLLSFDWYDTTFLESTCADVQKATSTVPPPCFSPEPGLESCSTANIESPPSNLEDPRYNWWIQRFQLQSLMQRRGLTQVNIEAVTTAVSDLQSCLVGNPVVSGLNAESGLGRAAMWKSMLKEEWRNSRIRGMSRQ